TVKMNNTLRKDAKRDCCFEISAPDKHHYQSQYLFCCSSVLRLRKIQKNMGGVIPEDEEEYDDCLPMNQPTNHPAPIDDDIYEELPEEDTPQPVKPTVTLANKPPPPSTPVTAVTKSTDYANYFQGLWDCAGEHPDELSFKRGDTIYILSKEYDMFGWWVGEMKGAIGIVPKEYLLDLYVL
uniref:Src kinase associated phosphoprotein 2 n=1 Tax=Sinocyclocheilus anshuiensis TaxID=1608454 RepID=A0A671KYK5_9TELE